MNSKIKVILTRKRHILVIIASLSIMLFLGAYFYFSYEVKTIRSEAYNELKAIATLKISQITNWNNERFTDVKIFSQNPFFVGSLENSLGSKSNASLKSEIIKNFTLINANSDYSNIILFNIEGKSLLSLDSKFQQIDSTTARFIKRAVKEKKIISTDLYRSSLHNEIYLDYIAPVIDKNSFVFAVLILRVNPETFLYPIIKEWPVPSKTSETLIVRREDGSALYLNELNHRRSAALILTIPLTRKEVPAVQAVLGRKGIFEGVSYHGTNVLSYISPVIGAPWIMIAQIDNSEIYAGLYYKEFVTISFTVLLILALSGGLFWFYHYRQRNIFRELFVKEKELRAHHEEFKTILYSIGDGVITIDTNGNIKQMNRTAEELTGWNEDEAKGKPVEEVFNIINEATRNRVENPFHKVLGEGIIAGLANRTLLISKNGDEIPISDSGAPIKSETGEILGVVLIFRNQTEERIAQKTIEESEERFRKIFEEHSAVKLLIDFATGNIVNVNKAAAEYYGWTKEELLQMNIREINILSTEEVKGEMEKAGRRTKNHFEFRHRLKNGSIRDVEVFSSKVDIGGTEYLYSIVHDITERKLAEEKLEKYSQELKELSARKDKLFSIIAHDLRSPFNPLLGLSEIMVNDFESLTPEEIKDFNKEIYNALKNEYTLLENLLNWSRLETGQMKLNPEKINLYDKTESVINLLSGNAKLKNITLINETDEDIFVSADPNMLHSVLQNLISNSIKFTNKDGIIKTYAEKVSNDFIQITVSDNGVGMTNDQTEDLFGLTATSTKGTNNEKGTGLGLMICKEMAERQGGTISVKSEVGKGTDISFTLPKAE